MSQNAGSNMDRFKRNEKNATYFFILRTIITLHYITLHYITLHYITLSITQLISLKKMLNGMTSYLMLNAELYEIMIIYIEELMAYNESCILHLQRQNMK